MRCVRRWWCGLRLLLAFSGLLSSQVFGLTVNRLNGGANIIYIDFSISGKSVPLELIRSYNSITGLSEQTGWSGAFGWGWTTPFETTLTVTPERHVLLRDGTTGNTILFRPDKEDPKIKDTFYESVRVAYFERKLGRKLETREMQTLKLPDKVSARLKTDPTFRAEMAAKFNISAAIPRGEVLVSAEYGYQTIQFKDNQWHRERDGITQIFDKEGRLTRQIDKNGFVFEFRYSTTNKSQVVEISDTGKLQILKFTWRQDRVVEVADSKNERARYSYDANGNLVQVIDSNNQTFFYKYENRKFPHLLTKIEYASEAGGGKDKVVRELQYDENGLVVLHRDKDGSETTFIFGKSASDPENNFWTKSVRKYKGQTEEQYDEYVIKPKADGTKYLYKQENRQNGVTTVTIFTPCCAKPLQVTRNGEVTNYKYYENGLLKERVGAKEDLRVEYDPKWKKVNKVSQNGFVSKYEYDEHGNLVRASNSRNEKVALKYDRFGRILEMADAQKRNIIFKYGDNGKPVVIEEKGVGIIRVEYDNDGRIKKTETIVTGRGGRKVSEDEKAPTVVKRVMKGFQQLLDIIRPAGITSLAGAG